MRLGAFLGLLMALAACDTSPVEWSDPMPAARQSASATLTIDTAGQPRFAADSVAAASAPAAPGICASSLRYAHGSSHLYATWWSARADSSAVLYSASSADSGTTWGKPTAVDTSDVSSNGCNRPPPAVATVGDDLHTAYSMVAPEGTGVFFAHFMGSMLHSPAAVIYGERLVPTAIAAEGDRVAVAYEEPNGSRKQVDVSMSTTQGHLFDWHVTASRDVDVASAPAVALAGKTLAVSWLTRRPTDSVGTRVVRVGRLAK
jgi:hypothetical protein